MPPMATPTTTPEQWLQTFEATVRAYTDGRPEHLRHAAMLDPNTAATLTLDQIWALCDEMGLS